MTGPSAATTAETVTCGWVASCDSPARHRVERQTRPGLILREAVCDDHVGVARRRGYLLRTPADGGGGAADR